MADTLIVNAAQADSWNGYEGEHWAANDDRYDTVNSGFNDLLIFDNWSIQHGRPALSVRHTGERGGTLQERFDTNIVNFIGRPFCLAPPAQWPSSATW